MLSPLSPLYCLKPFEENVLLEQGRILLETVCQGRSVSIDSCLVVTQPVSDCEHIRISLVVTDEVVTIPLNACV